MALTSSNMLPLGTLAPDFTLVDTVSSRSIHLYEDVGRSIFVIAFICNHCPYVVHINSTLVEIARKYQLKGVKFYGISSNDVTRYPQDGPEKMKEHALVHQYPFPYLYDESQEVAKAYNAACTPDFYVFDTEKKLRYRGRMDESRPGSNIPVSGEDLKRALDALIAGEQVPEPQYPSMGCNIKWK